MRRTEIMGFAGILAGIGIASAALLATVGKQELSSPLFIASVVVAVLSTGAFTLAGFSAVPSWVRPTLEGRRRPAPLIVYRWRYTTGSMEFLAVTVAMEIGLPGTSTKLPSDRPPWFRVVVTMACSEISLHDDPDLHYRCLESLLMKPLFKSVIKVS